MEHQSWEGSGFFALLVKLAGFPSVDLQVAVVVKVPVALRLDMFLGGCHPTKNARSKENPWANIRVTPTWVLVSRCFSMGQLGKFIQVMGMSCDPSKIRLLFFYLENTMTNIRGVTVLELQNGGKQLILKKFLHLINS